MKILERFQISLSTLSSWKVKYGLQQNTIFKLKNLEELPMKIKSEKLQHPCKLLNLGEVEK